MPRTSGFRLGLRSPRQLLRDTDGQVALFGAVLVVALLVLMLVIPNATHVMTRKARLQTAADAGAISGSVWFARALNLNANLNIGIRSGYTWMTVLTMGSALAQALYRDSLDASVRSMGSLLCSGLFGCTDPVYASSHIYPQSVQRLAETGQWLRDLQGAIAVCFPLVAEGSGWEQARLTAGGNPGPGGAVMVSTTDTMPTFVESHTGDSLLYSDLLQLGAALESIPTNDSNIGPATGMIVVDSSSYEVKAYYGDSSQWCDVRQVLKRLYKKCIIQTFRNNQSGVVDTGIEYFQKSGGGPYTAYLHGDSWARWVWKCNEGGTHVPFIWPNGRPVPPYKNTANWTLVETHPSDNRYKRDTVWVRKHVVRKTDPSIGKWNYSPWKSGDSILAKCKPYVNDSGDVVDSSRAYCTDFYTGADSTRGGQGARLRPRRLYPERDFQAVSFVFWDTGDSSGHTGLFPPLARAFFPRQKTGAAFPTFAVARSVLFLAVDSATARDYFFTPAWDVRLVPIDSAGVRQICDDSAYANHLSSVDLEGLQRHVFLP
jgi:hypothetical protein